MKLSRRQFLVASGASAIATFAPGRLVHALEKQAASTPAPKLDSWNDVRAQFDLAPGWMQFSSFYLVSHPRPVRNAIENFRKALDADPYLTIERGMFESEAGNMQLRVVRAIAEYLGCAPREIALTPNTTTGLALVYHGLPLAAGDEVLTTAQDHYVHHESIRMACERAGATWRRISLFDRPEDANANDIVQRIRAELKPTTRVLGVTWVHSSSGLRMPIRAIADMLAPINRARGEKEKLLLVVDGVHGLGAVEDTVADLGCDFFCAGTHKWMFAPRGTGIIWSRDENWARIRPLIPTFSELESFDAWIAGRAPAGPTVAARVTPGGFTAYEHQWAMGAAFDMHQRMGRARVADRIHALNDQLKAGLAATKNVTLHTPRSRELSAGLVAFEVGGVSNEDVVKRLLERRIVASTAPYRQNFARLAPSLVNTPQEVDAALSAVRAIAGA